MRNLSAISWQDQAAFWWNDDNDDSYFALDKHLISDEKIFNVSVNHVFLFMNQVDMRNLFALFVFIYLVSDKIVL